MKILRDWGFGGSSGGSSSINSVISSTPVTSLVYARVSTTVTVTQAGHGYLSGMLVTIASATDGGLNSASNSITVTGANAWTFTTASTGTAAGTLTVSSVSVLRHKVRDLLFSRR